jgi:hypothetical protein
VQVVFSLIVRRKLNGACDAPPGFASSPMGSTRTQANLRGDRPAPPSPALFQNRHEYFPPAGPPLSPAMHESPLVQTSRSNPNHASVNYASRSITKMLFPGSLTQANRIRRRLNQCVSVMEAVRSRLVRSARRRFTVVDGAFRIANLGPVQSAGRAHLR